MNRKQRERKRAMARAHTERRDNWGEAATGVKANDRRNARRDARREARRATRA